MQQYRIEMQLGKDQGIAAKQDPDSFKLYKVPFPY